MQDSLQEPRKHTRSVKFTPDEDEALKNYVAKLGDNKWTMVAQLMPGRTSRQCRERYRAYLAPNISNLPWTPEEDILLTKLVLSKGPHWALIAKQMSGRSDNQIKNRWNTYLKQREAMRILPQPKIKMPPPKEEEATLSHEDLVLINLGSDLLDPIFEVDF